MDHEWVLVEIDLAGWPVVEIWGREDGSLAVDVCEWPE